MIEHAPRPLASTHHGSGSTIVLLHGIGAAGSAFDALSELLSGDFRVVAVDFPGYGDSPDPAEHETLESIADRLAATVGPAPAHVVGVSFGALAALALARRHPSLVRSLTLADATLGRAMDSPADLACWREMRNRLAGNLAAECRDRARKIAGPHATGDMIETIAKHMLRARPIGYRTVTRIIAETDARSWPSELVVPVLVVCGEGDTVVGLPLSERIAEAVPDSRFVTIANAGHAPHIEATATFARAIAGFCRSVDDTRR